MHQRCSRVLAASVLAAGLAAMLGACGGAAALEQDKGAAIEYQGPLYLKPGEGRHPKAGAAGDAVDCRTFGFGQSLGDAVFSEGRTSDSPEDAVRNGAREGFPGGFLYLEDDDHEAARDTDRVLYVITVDYVIKEAVIVRNGPAAPNTGGPGWYVESWATCDYAELPPEYAESMGLQLWYDALGVPAPTTHLQSWNGAEHCDWQSMTILRMDDEAFVRNPLPEYQKYLSSPFEADIPLPKNALDTGYAREGRHLWLSPSGEQAFIGTPASVEAWPRSTEPFLCT